MATMKDIIQSPLLLALFGSMALGLFASSASGSKVVKGGINLHHRDTAHRHPYLLCAVEEGQDPGSR